MLKTSILPQNFAKMGGVSAPNVRIFGEKFSDNPKFLGGGNCPSAVTPLFVVDLLYNKP